MSVAQVNVPVVIIGGGPVGLAAAIGLRHWGVDCVVLEQHDSTLDFPKGRAVNARTMEIFSQWGIAADVLAVGWPAGETMLGYLGETLLSEDFRIVARSQPSTTGVSPWPDVVCSQEHGNGERFRCGPDAPWDAVERGWRSSPGLDVVQPRG